MTIETSTSGHHARLLPQLIKFGAVGGVGFVVNLLVFNGLMIFVLENVPHKTLYATAIATLVAIGTNWLGNRYWAFSGTRNENATREGVEFFIVSLAGMAIPLACVWVSHYLLGHHSLLADNISNNVIGLALGTVFRFGFYRWWVFSPRRSTARAGHAGSSELPAGISAGAHVPSRVIREKAPLTGSTLASTPDRGLVGD